MSDDKLLKLVGKLNVYTMATGDGRDIELAVVDDYISWRRVGDANWIPLVSVAELQGPSVAVIEEMQRSLDNKVEITNTIRAGNLLVASETGNLECSGYSCDDIFETLDRKVELVDPALADYIIVADGQGNLKNSGIRYTELLKIDDIATRSETVSKEISATGYSIIRIPSEVLDHDEISVYQNGMLLIKDLHYVVEDINIRLLKDTTYKGDIFTFVGHGITKPLGSSDTVVEGHTHDNKDILDNITQESLDKWESAANNSIEQVRVNGVSIPIVDNTLDINVSTGGSSTPIKSSDEIEVNPDGTLSIKKISFSKLFQDEVLFINGGTAANVGDMIFDGGNAEEW